MAFVDAKTRNPVEPFTVGRGTWMECEGDYLLVTGDQSSEKQVTWSFLLITTRSAVFKNR